MNRRRARGSKPNNPTHKIARDGSGTVDIPVVENRLLMELTLVVMKLGVLPP